MEATFSLTGINWLAVACLTILSFILGSLWHSQKLFGKAWMEDAKPVIDKANKAKNMRLFGLSALFHFIAVTALAALIGPESTAATGLFTGFVVSLAWVFTGIGVTYLFAGRPMRLLLIDAGFYVVFLSVAGLVLGVW